MTQREDPEWYFSEKVSKFDSSISGESIFEHIAHEIPQLKSRVSQKPGGAEAEPEAARKKSKKK